jgi:DedD protein
VASKFQNRLAGTVILVALGVIILPSLLDGKKKHYEDQFAAIPLVPKLGDIEEIDAIPPPTQPLPSHPPEGAKALVEQQAAVEAATQQEANRRSQPQAAEPMSTPPVEVKPTPLAVSPPIETKPKPPELPKVDVKPEPVVKPVAKPVVEEQAPLGQAYIVQLGALKNAAKVNEIIASLRLSGYRAYSVPSTPVQGEITRLYVGPEASKQRLQSSLSELNAISGLNGQIKAYRP